MREFTSGQFLNHNKQILAFLANLPEPEVNGTAYGNDMPSPRDLHLHPDVYEWVWDTLADALPEDCRTVVHGRAALQHPITGFLFAAGFGTHYVLRVPSQVIEDLKADEANFTKRIDKTRRVDLRENLKPDWVYGRFLPEELTWCRASYELAGGGK